jgi:hypothetical protein
MKHIGLLIATLSLSFGLAACGGSDNTCDQLAKKLCSGKDDATCKKTKAWLDSEMTGPDGKKLSSSDSNLACKMILDDKDAVAGYQEMANEAVK